MLQLVMDYQFHYNLLIQRAQERSILPGEYFEKHHIVPKCMGGTNDKDNLVKLFPEEHYVAHQLLVKIFPENNKLVWAAHRLTSGRDYQIRNNKLYGWIRRKVQKINQSKVLSDETKQKLRDANLGKKHSQVTKDLISSRQKEDYAAGRRVNALKGTKWTKKNNTQVPWSKGVKFTEEHRRKISDSHKGKKTGNRLPIVSCLNCKKETTTTGLTRFHSKCYAGTL